MEKRKVRNDKGFTLIELFIVLAIIGILAAIVFESVSKKKHKPINIVYDIYCWNALDSEQKATYSGETEELISTSENKISFKEKETGNIVILVNNTCKLTSK